MTETTEEKIVNIVKKLIGYYKQLENSGDDELTSVGIGLAFAIAIISAEFETSEEAKEVQKNMACTFNTIFGYNTYPESEGG